MAQDSSIKDMVETGNQGLFPEKFPDSLQEYHLFYRQSIEHREEFWSRQANRVAWDAPFTQVVHENFSNGAVSWFEGGKLNAARNVLEANLKNGAAAKPALRYFTGDGGLVSLSRQDLDREVRLLAAALEAYGMKMGDRVALYLPDSPETVFFMLACSCLGLICVPIPVRYPAEITREIVQDSGARILIVSFTRTSQSYEARAQSVIESLMGIPVINTGDREVEGTIPYKRFVSPDTLKPLESLTSVTAEHPFFILYANSASGIPRGSVFATGGFLVQAAASYDYIFRPTGEGADVKSVVCLLELASAAGQSYGLWGPLMNGACLVLTDGGLQSTGGHVLRVLKECESPALLTTPTLLSELRRELNNGPLDIARRFSLVACSGDVLKPRLISFATQSLVSKPEHVLNLWIQSECGSAIIATFPYSELARSGALGLAFPGVEPLVYNYLSQICRPNESGHLVFKSSWPSMIRTIWGQEERYRQLYFQRVPGCYSTNDGIRLDGDGFYWFMGRLDDVIKVRGQSLATSEIEAVLVTHPLVSEAAVVSVEGDGGETLAAFLVMDQAMIDVNREIDKNSLESELSQSVIRRIGEFAAISQYIIAEELPRTRTGKIVRRVLRRIATGDITSNEDLSHLANPESVEELIRKKGL
ncbi:MAG: AMP-binding protein [Candidatus Latescibacter sp.]|nr:AMP-binding protein [Candidatus Latescibacter sp.]